VGSGPEEERLRAMCESAGYAERVHFPGSVPHEQLQQFYADANVFAFPSIRELGGAVVLEAMYMGVTPIVIDYGGPPEFVPAGTGVCLPMGRREAIVSDLRTALERAAADPSRLGEMGAAARRLVTERHTWDAKAKSVVEIYEWVLGRGPRPDLAPPAEDLRCGFDDRDADVVARSGGAPRAPKPHARAVAARN
ncbi:MAG: glycosyltransferase family 4 protein, partial [Planctomycetota bacterium]